MPPPVDQADATTRDVAMKEDGKAYICGSHDLLHAIIGPISLFERQ